MGNSGEVAKVVLDLDNQAFVSKLKESLGLIGELGKADSMAGLSQTLKIVSVGAGVLSAAIYGIKTAYDKTLEAEKLKATEYAFDALTKQAGLMGEELKTGLEKAAKGMVTTHELLEAANKAVVQLGSNASRIPEVMELARKVTKVFGGDAVERFEQINQAVATGNMRQLRHMGIIVDLDKAVRDHAKSLGHSREALSMFGEQTARMNAILHDGSKGFEGLDKNMKPVTSTMKQIHVLLEEMGEQSAKTWDKIFGPAIAASVQLARDAIKSLFNVHEETKKAGSQFDEQINTFFEQLTKAKAKLTEMKNRRDEGGFFAPTQQSIDLQQKTVEAIQKSIDALAQKRDAEVKTAEETEKLKNKSSKDDQLRREVVLQEHIKFENAMLNLKKSRLDQEIRNNSDSTVSEGLYLAQRLQLYEEWKAKIVQIDQEYKGREDMAKQLKDETDKIWAEKIIEHQRNSQEKITEMQFEADNKRLKHAQSTNEAIALSAKAQANKAAADLQNYGRRGEMVFNTLKKHTKSAFIEMGEGSKSAGDVMKKFMFNSLADIAEAEGELHMLAGFSNPVEFAAGAALLALSGFLRSQGGGSSGGGSGAGGGGGGSAMGPESSTVDQKPEAKEVQKKAVTVNIQGSYYETEQTRERLMTMIREAGDFTDFNLKQIGQP